MAEHALCDFAGALWHGSPSYGPRRGCAVPDCVVLHYTAMDSAEAALERLCDPQVEVSAHYLISNTGTVWQMVREDQRAWHAGAGRWAGADDINSCSVGIELDNRGDHPFAAPQMRALEALLADILRRHEIRPERVIGHSDMAPQRKIDPGPRFDWQRLARQGLAVWPDHAADARSSASLAEALSVIGYPVAELGEAACLEAFRLRFRPWAQGAADSADCALAADLAARFGVDPGTGLA